MNKFDKLLFSEMRTVIISPDENRPLTDSDMIEAMTIDRELQQFGYSLKPQDIVRLARCNSKKDVLDKVREAVDHRGFRPMYPDFPNQVVEMDEAKYRFHQMVHYFSTYGVEGLFGVEVSHGWMPSGNETEKTESDSRLEYLSFIDLNTEKEAIEKTVKAVVHKKERWVNNENLLAGEIVRLDPNSVKGIPFKENLVSLYSCMNDMCIDKDTRNTVIKNNCQHPGDILKLADSIYNQNRLKNGKPRFSTGEKKFFVKLLESYPVDSFRENIALDRNRNVFVLGQLSYQRFSNSSEHMKAVSDLRNDDIRTFNSVLERKIREHASDTLEFYASRPGLMLRNCGRLLREGWTSDEIISSLKGKEFKAQTLIGNINMFENAKSSYIYGCKRKPVGLSMSRTEAEEAELSKIFRNLLEEDMKKWNTPLKDKEVYFEPGNFIPEDSIVPANVKNEEGGYILPGLAYSFSSDAKVLRLFCFWNDPNKRVDLDLHAFGFMEDDKEIHVGWNSSYKTNGLVMSGDITTSDNSAEYLDVNLSEAKQLKYVTMVISSYTEQPFKNIETSYIGITSVSKTGEDVKQYEPKNLLYHHELNSDQKEINYAVIDVEKQQIRLMSSEENSHEFIRNIGFSLKDYMDMLFKAQNCKIITDAKDREFADVILQLDKGADEKCVSLIDHNFFMPAEDKSARTEEKTAEQSRER